jgi:hypothetical protein
VPGQVATLVAKMMAKDPAQRFQTLEEVARALEPFAGGGDAAHLGPTPARRGSSDPADEEWHRRNSLTWPPIGVGHQIWGPRLAASLGARSVTINARVTAMIDTGDQQSALVLVDFLSPAYPAGRRRPCYSWMAAGPVFGGKVR